MSEIQLEHLKIARRAVLGCGGRIVRELYLEDGTRRIVFDGVDTEKLKVTLEVMIPGSVFKELSYGSPGS